METTKELFAFISYKREDEKWAKWLQYKLEHYKLPIAKNDGTSKRATKIKTIRDTTDFSGGNLEEAITNALNQSHYLIVICSPKAAQSQWVCKEVSQFINAGKEKNIIPFIIEGKPNSTDVNTECFPQALRDLSGKREILGININDLGRDAAAVKVVARMFNVFFDTLWQRYEREKRKKRLGAISAILLLFICLLCVSVYIAKKNVELENSHKEIQLREKEATTNWGKYLDQTAKTLTTTGNAWKGICQITDFINSTGMNIPEFENTLRAAVDSIIYGKQYASFMGLPSAVIDVDVSMEDNLIIAASQYSIIGWDLTSLEQRFFITSEEDVSSISYNSKYDLIATTQGFGNDLTIYNLNDIKNPMLVAQGYDITFSNDNLFRWQCINIGREDAIIQKIQIDNNEIIKEFNGCILNWSPNKRYMLYLKEDDGYIHVNIYDTNTNSNTILNHVDDFYSYQGAINDTGDLYSLSNDSVIYFYDKHANLLHKTPFVNIFSTSFIQNHAICVNETCTFCVSLVDSIAISEPSFLERTHYIKGVQDKVIYGYNNDIVVGNNPFVKSNRYNYSKVNHKLHSFVGHGTYLDADDSFYYIYHDNKIINQFKSSHTNYINSNIWDYNESTHELILAENPLDGSFVLDLTQDSITMHIDAMIANFLPNNKELLLYDSFSPQAIVFNYETGDTIARLNCGNNCITSTKLFHNENILVTASSLGEIRFWNTSDYTEIDSLNFDINYEIYHFDISPDNEYIAFIKGDNICIYHINSHLCVGRIHIPNIFEVSFDDNFSNNYNILYLGSDPSETAKSSPNDEESILEFLDNCSYVIGRTKFNSFNSILDYCNSLKSSNVFNWKPQE